MQKLLEDINNDFFLDNDSSAIERMIANRLIDKEAINKKWLGYLPANEKQIALKEKLLGVTLPSSYKKFFRISNGFRFISFFLDNLLPIDKIDWTVNSLEKSTLSMFEYLEDEITEQCFYHEADKRLNELILTKNEHFIKSIRIADWYDGMCVFLNPAVRYGDEWEILVYANWDPVTRHYRSFEEFLKWTHKENLEILKDQNRI